MGDDVQPIQMTRAAAVRFIRETAQVTARVVIPYHATGRMRSKHITRKQVHDCLRQGFITEGPFQNIKGNWQCTMYRRLAGEDISVAVALDPPGMLTVITVMND